MAELCGYAPLHPDLLGCAEPSRAVRLTAVLPASLHISTRQRRHRQSTTSIPYPTHHPTTTRTGVARISVLQRALLTKWQRNHHTTAAAVCDLSKPVQLAKFC